jgi:CRISPR-associated protein Cas1
MTTLGESGASVVWVGESGSRFYGFGLGETRRAGNLQAQAAAWADPEQHLQVVRRMYSMRFTDGLEPGLTLAQIRGREGVRVREAYAAAAKHTGIVWRGRQYDASRWEASDPVNRALSAANACLYGLCHAAIVATGFSPGLGFIHLGKMLSFVYDIADLYKCDTTIPAAFAMAAVGDAFGIEGAVRRRCRELFRETRLIERIVPDIQRAIGVAPEPVTYIEHRGAPRMDAGALWDPAGDVDGGENHAPTWEEEHILKVDARARRGPGGVERGSPAPLDPEDS